ncbi:hypothetical protein NUW54_g13595 [Trametes sanguinea]|uniref:Uncharacterized protein n=1 Tax=Trametes sanguinea TaxID=158606 RepID=A0ACC1MLD5_9APHY|nr:hypothetical protein NUW54_g13595 [Trametes sanguinea]
MARKNLSIQTTQIQALFKMNIFGFEVDDTAELMPLVDLWFELTDHLTPETIPSPTELYEEHEEIMRIIHDARERAPSIRAPFIDNGVAIDYDNLSTLESVNTDDLCRDDLAHERPELRLRYGIPLDEEIYPDQPVPHRTAFTIFKTLKRRTKKVLHVIVPWRNHPPCLPYWY